MIGQGYPRSRAAAREAAQTSSGGCAWRAAILTDSRKRSLQVERHDASAGNVALAVSALSADAVACGSNGG
jgi:hypothetical protein